MSVTAEREGSAVARTVRDFLDSELAGIDLAGAGRRGDEVRVAGIGTMAPRSLGSAMLADAFAEESLTLVADQAYPGPDALLAASSWDLALVLSPHKRAVLPALALASPTTAAAGVADTLLRGGDTVTGVNTNSWAVVAALRCLVPAGGPERVLLLGAGASARSTVLGVRRTWPHVQIVCSARDPSAAGELAALVDGTTVDAVDIGDVAPDVVVNSTTWGETAESEQRPYAFPFADVLRPGRAFFDLNNRRSTLAEQALDRACAVMSGTLMQVVTHNCRAAMAERLAARGDEPGSADESSEDGRGQA